MKYMRPFIAPWAICFVCFVGAFLAGFALLPHENLDTAALRTEISARTGLPGFVILSRVLQANVVAFFAMAAGAITMGLASVAHLGIAGAFLGRDASRAMTAGFSPTEFFARTAPHGVLELAGFILVASIGIRICIPFIKYLKTGVFLERDDWRGLVLVAATAFTLIFAAAFVEAFVTPALLTPG
jgi:uncharacterized membrane protein SpoIIM required for sporulation